MRIALRPPPGTALISAAVVAAVAVGAAYPISAAVTHPILLPVALLGAALAAVSFRRIEIGIALAPPLVALNPELVGSSAWLPGLVWSALLFVVALVRNDASARDRHLPPFSVFVLLNVMVLLIGFVRAPDQTAAIAVIRSALTGIFLFFAIATQVRTRRQVEWVVGGFMAGAALIGGLATLQLLGGTGATAGFITQSGQLVDRVAGGLGHPNQLGGFLVVLVPLVAAAAMADRRLLPPSLAVGAVAVAGIYASFSRGSIVALGGILLVLLRPRSVVLVVPAVLALTLALAPDALEERFETSSGAGSELSSRVDIWNTAHAIWVDQPLLGAGAGSFPTAYSEARVPGKQFLPATAFQPPPHGHNLYLHLLAELGLLGAFSFLGLFAVMVVELVRVRMRAAESWARVYARGILAAMAGFAIHNIFDVTLLEQTGSYIWALLGLASALVVIGRPAAAAA